jgi:hypothetical protein
MMNDPSLKTPITCDPWSSSNDHRPFALSFEGEGVGVSVGEDAELEPPPPHATSKKDAVRIANDKYSFFLRYVLNCY